MAGLTTGTYLGKSFSGTAMQWPDEVWFGQTRCQTCALAHCRPAVPLGFTLQGLTKVMFHFGLAPANCVLELIIVLLAP